MAKTNAEKQREYREKKKAIDGLKYLEKERSRQKRNYIKVESLSKKELKEQILLLLNTETKQSLK